jgi:hypothetical protein
MQFTLRHALRRCATPRCSTPWNARPRNASAPALRASGWRSRHSFGRDWTLRVQATIGLFLSTARRHALPRYARQRYATRRIAALRAATLRNEVLPNFAEAFGSNDWFVHMDQIRYAAPRAATLRDTLPRSATRHPAMLCLATQRLVYSMVQPRSALRRSSLQHSTPQLSAALRSSTIGLFIWFNASPR